MFKLSAFQSIPARIIGVFFRYGRYAKPNVSGSYLNKVFLVRA
jgi:hypothetical protein